MSAALNYTNLVLLWSLFFSLLYLPFRYLTLRKDTTVSHEVGLLLFWISVVAVLSQTLTADGTVTGFGFTLEHIQDGFYYNFRPFRIFERIADKPAAERFSYALVNVPGNILLFVPVGFAASWAFRWGVGKATLGGGLLSLLVELGQIFLPRTTDIDDLWMNTLGAFFGAVAWILFKKLNDKIPELPPVPAGGESPRAEEPPGAPDSPAPAEEAAPSASSAPPIGEGNEPPRKN